MSKIPRPAPGSPSNPPSPIVSNNPFQAHLDPLASPISLQAGRPSVSGTSSISFYSQSSATINQSSPGASPQGGTQIPLKRRPAPSFDSLTGNQHSPSTPSSLRSKPPLQHPRNISAPGSLPNAKYRSVSVTPSPGSFKPGFKPIRSYQESPNGFSQPTGHPQAANASPLRDPKTNHTPGHHYQKRSAAASGGTGKREEPSLISLDSSYTLLVTTPDGQQQVGGAVGEAASHSNVTQRLEQGANLSAYGGIKMDTSEGTSMDGVEMDKTPSHISYRLDLIDHLGEVLGMSSNEIRAKLDVPGLMHRVDAMHKRSSRIPGELDAMPHKTGGATSDEAYNELLCRLSEMTSMEKWESSSSKVDSPVRIGTPVQSSLGMSLASEAASLVEEQDGRYPKFTDTGIATAESSRRAMVFGVKLDEAPIGSWCTSLIGGQRHELPLVIFNIIEEIFKRGMRTPGLFRLSGDSERTSELYQAYNRPPFYGDNLDLSVEPIANLTSVVKRYIRDLPYPILDESLFEVFGSFCSESALEMERCSRASSDTATSSEKSQSERHIVAAQILIRLLPPLQFSLFVYLLAFLGQLQQYQENKLDVAGIAAIFGPGMCASRMKGIPGLGPGSTPNKSLGSSQSEEAEKRASIRKLLDQSESILGWLLQKWPMISDNLLDPAYDEHFRRPDPYEGLAAALSPKLISEQDKDPIAQSVARDKEDARPKLRRSDTPALRLPERTLRKQQSMPAFANHAMSPSPSTPVEHMPSHRRLPELSNSQSSSRRGSDETTLTSTTTATTIPSAIPRPSKSDKKAVPPQTPAKGKSKKTLRSRSASFGSISSLKSLFKRGGDAGLDEAGDMKLTERKLPKPSDDRVGVSQARGTIAKAAYEPETKASVVLGSLHDLLVSKDRQIAKDAQEIKLLREALARGAEPDPDPRPGLGLGSESGSGHRSGPSDAITSNSTPPRPQTKNPNPIGTPPHAQARLSALMSDLESAKLEYARKDSHISKLQIKIQKLEKDLEAAQVGMDGLGRQLVAVKGELQVEKGLRVKAEEEREKDRKKLEDVRGIMFGGQ